MKQIAVALGFCGCLLSGLALADELDDFTDKLLKNAPLKCLEEASTITGDHLRRKLPDMLLDGFREGAQMGPAWAQGNDNYRQARDLLEIALQDDEASKGPIVDIGVHRLVRTAVANWTPAQRIEVPAFLKQKGGRLYWEKVMDGMLCKALIDSAQKPPHALQPGKELSRLQALAIGVAGTEVTMEMEFSLLPQDQQAKVKKWIPVLNSSMTEAFRVLHTAYPQRAKEALTPIVPELGKIARAYKQQ